MKKILSLLFITTLILTSCEGEEGPRGPQGPAGEDGLDASEAVIFEIESDFTYDDEANLWATDFVAFEDYSDVVVFETDVVLIYRLNAVGQLDDGSDVDEWSLLPQNFFTEEGTIQYVYNHTFVDTEIFIDGNYDLASLDSDYVSDQIIRVVIIPADFYETSGVDPANMEAVLKALNINEKK